MNNVLKCLTPEQIIEISVEMDGALSYMKDHKKKDEKIPETIDETDYFTPLYLFATHFGLASADRQNAKEESDAIFSVMKVAYEKAYKRLMRNI